MLRIVVFLLCVFSFSVHAQVKDTIFGKPKFVKEYVVFLNNSGPFTFMQGDDEYGHATIMEPKNLRESMVESWFETYFCRYINNETQYDNKGRIVREKWFYKSGKLIDDYKYSYDTRGRLKTQIDSSENSYRKRVFYYEGNQEKPFLVDYFSEWGGRKPKKILSFKNQHFFKQVTEYDTINKFDLVYNITNQVRKKYSENGEVFYRDIKDTIYYKIPLAKRYYDNQWRKIKDVWIKKIGDSIVETGNFAEYQYDDKDRTVSKKTFERSFLGESNSEERFAFYPNGFLKSFEFYYKGNLYLSRQYKYINEHIVNLDYFETNPNKQKSVIFRYKVDKHKNWTEITKNVDGKDLYIWKREIQYY